MKRSQQNTLPSVFITPLEYTNEILYPQGSTNITDSPILTLEVFNKHMIFFPIHYQHHYSRLGYILKILIFALQKLRMVLKLVLQIIKMIFMAVLGLHQSFFYLDRL